MEWLDMGNGDEPDRAFQPDRSVRRVLHVGFGLHGRWIRRSRRHYGDPGSVMERINMD
jgi:hypothetical protein